FRPPLLPYSFVRSPAEPFFRPGPHAAQPARGAAVKDGHLWPPEHRRARLGLVLEPLPSKQARTPAWRRSFRTWRCRMRLRSSPSRAAHPLPDNAAQTRWRYIASPVGVMDHAVRAARGERHVKRIQYQPCDKLAAHRPADNASRTTAKYKKLAAVGT